MTSQKQNTAVVLSPTDDSSLRMNNSSSIFCLLFCQQLYIFCFSHACIDFVAFAEENDFSAISHMAKP
jgi:hypothetical protein